MSPVAPVRPASRARTAAPAARRSASGSKAASLPPAASPKPTAAISGAASLPPDGILVTSPASPVAPSVTSVCARVPPSASSTSLVPGTGSAPPASLVTPMTTASASTRWGEASLMCNVIPTASTLVPGRALLASTGGPARGTAPPRYARRVMADGTRSTRGEPPAGPAGGTRVRARSALGEHHRGRVRCGRRNGPGADRQLDRAEVRIAEVEQGHEVADRGPDLRHVGLGCRVRQIVLAVGGQRLQ